VNGGGGGGVISSPDGVTWKTRQLPIPDNYSSRGNILAVAFGNRSFVIAGYGDIIEQSDPF